jgi:hypothetical protein
VPVKGKTSKLATKAKPKRAVRSSRVSRTPRGVRTLKASMKFFNSRLGLAIAVFVIVGVAFVWYSEAAASPEILSGVAGHCLDDYQGKALNGTKVDSFACNGTSSQRWALKSNGTIQLLGKCLDVYQAKKTNGALLDLYSCTGGTNQQWAYNKTSHALVGKASGKCIDIPHATTANGVQVQIWSCLGNKQQKWTFTQFAAPSTPPTKTPVPAATPIETATPAGSTSGSTASGFVSVSGRNLMLGGKPYRFVGFDFGPVGDCWDTNYTTAQMDAYFSALPANSMARFFAPDDGSDSAAFVASVVHEADKYSIKLIISLGDANSDNQCDPTDTASTGSGKTTAYYQTAATSGSEWEKWVHSVVPPLASDPGVGIWEITNEPFHEGNTFYNGVSFSVMQSYVNNAAAYIRSLDKNHLVSIGIADVGDAGGSESDYQALFANLSILDFHDYSWDWGGGTVISGDLATVKQAATKLNKPYMSDEMGISAGPACTSFTPNGNTADTSTNKAGIGSLATRVTWLRNKINTELATTGTNGGMSGVDFWQYVPAGWNEGNCNFEFQPSDPMIPAVKSYKLPS